MEVDRAKLGVGGKEGHGFSLHRALWRPESLALLSSELWFGIRN